MAGQNIQELGFDLPKFDASKEHVIAGMKEVIAQAQAISPELKKVFDTIVAASNTKISMGSAGGIGELKTQVANLTKEVDNLKKANAELAAVQQRSNESIRQGADDYKQATPALKQYSDQQVIAANNLKKNEDALAKQNDVLAKESNWLRQLKSELDSYNEAHYASGAHAADAPTTKETNLKKKIFDSEASYAKEKEVTDQLSAAVEKSKQEYEAATIAAEQHASSVANDTIASDGMLKTLQENIDQSDIYKNKTTEIIEQLRSLKEVKDAMVKGGASKEEINAIDAVRRSLGEELSAIKRVNNELEKTIDLQMQNKGVGTKKVDQSTTPSLAGAALATGADQVQKYAIAQEQLNSVLAVTQVRSTEIANEKKALAAEYKEVTNQVNDNKISVEEATEKYNAYILKLSELNKEQQEIKAVQYDVNLSLRNIAKEALNAEGTLEQMKAQLELLKFSYSHLNEEEKKTEFGVGLQAKSKALSDEINKQKVAMGDYTSNVARYAESLAPAFDMIGAEIDKLKIKQQGLQDLSKNNPVGFQLPGDSGGPSGAAQLEQTTTAIRNLEQIQQIGFKTNQSYAQSISGLEKEFVNLSQGGGQSEAFLKEFGQFILKAKNDIKGLQDQLNVNTKSANFTNAVNILKTALTDAKGKLQQLTEAGQQNTAQGQQAAKEVELLTTLVNQQGAGFTTLTREIMNTRNALMEMENAGLKGTETYEQLNKQFVASSQKLHEFNNENKILTSTTPKLAALTAAARGLGGIYATGAGAASLFAGENEHVQKELNKLVAVMTLLQGLQELNHLVMEKNAIATALFGTATATTTTLIEGENVALTEGAVAAGFFARALDFIKANPIIAVLGALAAVVAVLVATHKEEEVQLWKTAEAEKAYAGALSLTTTAIEDQNKLLNKKLELNLKSLEADLSAAQASGQSQEKTLLLNKKILEIKSIISGNDLKTIPEINALIEKQERALSGLVAEQIASGQSQSELIEKSEKGAKSYFGTIKNLATGQVVQTKINIKTALENLKKEGEERQAAIDATKSSLAELQKVKDTAEEDERKKKEHALVTSKFYSDEERKERLAAAQAEAAIVQQKNTLILASEHSSFDERISAIQSNEQVAKNLAKAEMENVVMDASRTNKDRLIATQKYWDAVGGIDEKGKQHESSIQKEGNAAIQKETEDHNKRMLALKYQAIKESIEADSKVNEDISKDPQQSLNVRLTAYQKYLADQKQLIIGEQNEQIKQQGLDNEEEVAKDKEKQEKLLAIKNAATRKMNDLTKNGYEELKSIRESADKENDKNDADANDIVLKNIANEFDARQSALLRQYSEGKISQKKFNEESQKLQAEKQIAILNSELYQTQVIINQQKERFAAAKAEFEAEMALREAEAITISDPEEQKKAFAAIDAAKDKFKNAEIDRNNEIEKSEQKLATLRISLDNLVSNLLKSTGDKTKEHYVNLFKSIADIASQTLDIIGGFVDASTVKEKNRIQALINANDEYAQAEADRITKSTLSEQDKAAKLIQLKALTDAKDKQFAREQKQRDIEKAKFEKAAAIAKIVLNTAVAITKYLSVAEYAQAIIAGIIGAAELAVAVATQIPTYAEGTEDHPGGKARTGEKGAEAIKEPGKPWRITERDTTMVLAKHTKVVPLTEIQQNTTIKPVVIPLTTQEINNAMYGSMIVNTVDRLLLVESIEKKGSNDAWRIAKWQAEQTRQALEANNKKQPLNITNRIQIDLDHAAWVNKYVFGK